MGDHAAIPDALWYLTTGIIIATALLVPLHLEGAIVLLPLMALLALPVAWAAYSSRHAWPDGSAWWAAAFAWLLAATPPLASMGPGMGCDRAGLHGAFRIPHQALLHTPGLAVGVVVPLGLLLLLAAVVAWRQDRANAAVCTVAAVAFYWIALPISALLHGCPEI